MEIIKNTFDTMRKAEETIDNLLKSTYDVKMIVYEE